MAKQMQPYIALMVSIEEHLLEVYSPALWTDALRQLKRKRSERAARLTKICF
jgi:hypothetical protein